MVQIRHPGDNKAGSQQKIVNIQSSTNRNTLELENGEFWFWGGFFYEDHQKASIAGFNLLNEEEGLSSVLSKANTQIVSHGLGFAHDAVLVGDGPTLEFVEIDDE